MMKDLAAVLDRVSGLPSDLTWLPVHADFNEMNLVFRDGKVALVCDWEAFVGQLFWEHLATTIARFCSHREPPGVLSKNRMGTFIAALDPRVVAMIGDKPAFSVLFPYLATLRHLRVFLFRIAAVRKYRRLDLVGPFLHWPVSHCTWLVKHADTASAWIAELLSSQRHPEGR